MFTYYKAVEKEEHMLFAKEIIEVYQYNGKKFTAKKIGNIIDSYVKKHEIEYEQLYYATRYGVCRVYPFEIYDPAMKWYLEKLDAKE